jgi:hypothetical protein
MVVQVSYNLLLYRAGDVSRDITAMEMSIMSKLTEAVLQNAASLEVAVNLAAQLGKNNRFKYQRLISV